MRRPARATIGAVALAAATLLAAAARGDEGRGRFPLPPRYVEECGSCHVAYPARALSAASWRAVLAGLDAHFGTDASLDPSVREELRVLLESGTGHRETSREGRPLLRITETRWFRGEHDELRADVWKRPQVGSPANCGACHVGAEQGDYSEDRIRIPRGGGAR